MKTFVHFSILLAFQLFGSSSSAFAQLIVAHRGASAEAPENTLASFRLAWEQGADAIEGDFHLTADKQIVCIHDKDTERVSGIKLDVPSATLAELRTLDVGSWKDRRFLNERIPTLQEVLATTPCGKRIFIEIKCGPEVLPCLKCHMSESCLLPEQMTIISFNKHVIREAKQIMPCIKAYWLASFKKDESTGLWTPAVDDIIATANRIHADGVDVQNRQEMLDSRFVSLCRQHGLSMHVWTVDDPDSALRLRQLGFSSITTNRPGYLRCSLDKGYNSRPQTPAMPPLGITSPATQPVAAGE